MIVSLQALSKPPEENWMVMDAHKQHLGLAFSSTECDIMGREYKVMESLAHYFPAFVRPTCIKALGKCQIVSELSMHNKFNY